MNNTNSSLDPQSPIYTFAQFTTEEHEEYQRYLDAQQARAEMEADERARLADEAEPSDESHAYSDDWGYDASGDTWDF